MTLLNNYLNNLQMTSSSYCVFLLNYLIWQCFFLDLTPIALATKTKINWWDYITLQSFYTAKETIHEMKGQFMGWEEIFANHMSNKRLISNIHK